MLRVERKELKYGRGDKKMKPTIKEDLQRYIKEAVKAADYAAEDAVRGAIGSLTHKDFLRQHFVFDLRKCYLPESAKKMIKGVVRKTTNISPDRISFLLLREEDDEE